MPLNEKQSNSIFQNLPKLQKTVIIFFLTLIALIIIFWVWQMRTQIKSPFTDPYQQKSSVNSNSVATSSSAAIDLLKETDTDGDGLSDYAEIYIYHTSPYLVDSDSDGRSDFQEVRQGTNPNCPQGKDCGTSVPLRNTDSSKSVSNFNQTIATSTTAAFTNSTINNFQATSTAQSDLQKVLNGQANVQTLRKVLISSGISTKVKLDKISDSELMKSYQESLNSKK